MRRRIGRFAHNRVVRLAVVLLLIGGAYVGGVMSPYLVPGVANPVWLVSASVLRPLAEQVKEWTQTAAPTASRETMGKDSFTVTGDTSLPGTVMFALYGTPSDYPNRIVEVDRKGQVVWRYSAPGEARVADVRKLGNGHVLFNTLDSSEAAARRNGFVTGGTVYEVDRSGKVLRHQHVPVTHHAELLPSGNLLLADEGSEAVTEIDPEGRTVWAWRARDHLQPYSGANFVGDQPSLQIRNVYTAGSEYPALLGTDWIHLNSAQRLANGDTVISLRNFDLVVEVNRAGDVVWSYGPLVLKHQHCAFVLPNDHLLVADNGNARIVEVDRRTQQIVWQYDAGLYFPVQGCAYRLPSGNTVITDSSHLRVIEVGPDKGQLWELKVNVPATSPLYRAWWSPS